MSRKQTRNKPLNNLLSKVRQYTVEERRIFVSFRHLSNNKRRNFDFFGDKRWREKARALEQLFSFLQRLTAKRRIELMALPKEVDCGFENLPYSRVNCTPTDCVLSAETLISVFRFGDNGDGGNYRLLGCFEENTSVLNVIGFDFNYSAYRHE